MFAVVYGANTSWAGGAFPKSAGNVSCSNGTFGDPLPGAGKACGVAVITGTGFSAQTAPAMQSCAVEGQNCNVSGANVVAYGADSRWSVKVMNGNFLCGNAAFGDPAPGAGKACMVAPLAALGRFGVEGQTSTLPDGAMSVVVFGAQASWAGRAFPKSAGNVPCNFATFGDPLPGFGKFCGVAVMTGAAPSIQQAAVDEPTEFFWKGTYGRGVGTVLDACPAGKTKRGALCYDNCREGYSDNGTLTCATNCPSGYSDRGALCHFEGTGSYSPVRWDGCASRIAGICVGGFKEDGCRDGYTKRASVCYYERVPAGMSGTGMDPMKGMYNLTPVAMVCGGGKQQDAGLCYTPCRAGYNGVGPLCWAAVPSGYVDCGMGYAINSTACGFIVTDQVVNVLSLVKDACAITNFPGVSQACAIGGSKYMQAKALAKSGVKSVSELASNTALAAKLANKAQNMMAAMQKAQPAIDRLVSSFGAPIKSLAGKGADALPDFGVSMAKVGETFKDPATIASLYGIAQTFRGAAEEPPFKLSGTPTEQAFKIIRDISAQFGTGVALSTLVIPGFEASPPGQAFVATASLLGAVSAYLYTVQGQ